MPTGSPRCRGPRGLTVCAAISSVALALGAFGCREPIARAARSAPLRITNTFFAKHATLEPAEASLEAFADGSARCENARPIALPGEAVAQFSSGAETPVREPNSAGGHRRGTRQYFSIDLRQGDVIRVTLDDRGSFDATVHVLPHCGDLLGTTVDGHVNSPAPPLTFASPESGRYVIVVDAWLGDRGGAYAIKVTPVLR